MSNNLTMKINKKNHLPFGLCITAMFALLAITSCKKEVNVSLPDDRESAGINFYITSDVMNAAYGPTRGVTAAYVDSIKKQQTILYNSSGTYPTFAFGYLANPEFPMVSSLSSLNLFTYSRYATGNRQVLFTDVNNTIVADTTQVLTKGTWNTLYLTDKPQQSGAEAAYTIISVSEPRAVQEGKIGVRFVNLSPDAGPLDCKEIPADGTPPTRILSTVSYGQASDYTWLSQAEAINGLLRVQIDNTQINLTTGIPARPGRAFVVVIRGFANSTTRRVTVGKNADGSLHKETIQINAEVRTEVRASN